MAVNFQIGDRVQVHTGMRGVVVDIRKDYDDTPSSDTLYTITYDAKNYAQAVWYGQSLTLLTRFKISYEV